MANVDFIMGDYFEACSRILEICPIVFGVLEYPERFKDVIKVAVLKSNVF